MGDPHPEKIHGFEAELYAGTNTAGERLKAWVTLDYGLNLREIVTDSDGNPKHEWRLLEVDRSEPDAALFLPPR